MSEMTMAMPVDGRDLSLFRMTPDGLFKAQRRGRGEVWVCAPFEVVARTRNVLGLQWGLALRFLDPDRNVHQVVVSNRILHGRPLQVTGKLASHGLRLQGGPSAAKALKEYLLRARSPHRIRIPDEQWME